MDLYCIKTSFISSLIGKIIDLMILHGFSKSHLFLKQTMNVNVLWPKQLLDKIALIKGDFDLTEASSYIIKKEAKWSWIYNIEEKKNTKQIDWLIFRIFFFRMIVSILIFSTCTTASPISKSVGFFFLLKMNNNHLNIVNNVIDFDHERYVQHALTSLKLNNLTWIVSALTMCHRYERHFFYVQNFIYIVWNQR